MTKSPMLGCRPNSASKISKLAALSSSACRTPVQNLMQSQNAVPPGLAFSHESLRTDLNLPGTQFAVLKHTSSFSLPHGTANAKEPWRLRPQRGCQSSTAQLPRVPTMQTTSALTLIYIIRYAQAPSPPYWASQTTS